MSRTEFVNKSEVTVLSSINFLCSELAIYGVTKHFYIWLPQRLFTQVLLDLKTRIIDNGLFNADSFDPIAAAKEDKFVYEDPQGFRYTFQKASLLMITTE